MKQSVFKTKDFKESLNLYLIALPVIVLIIVFCYIPMYGVIIAFQDYVPGRSMFSLDDSVEWVGLQHFRDFISGPYFFRLLRNTLWLSFLNITFGFWIPIVFALLLDQVRQLRVKKIIQTSSYMPYFISTVVVAGMAISFLDTDGIANQLRALFGQEAYVFLNDKDSFALIYTIINIWKSFGFASILYISTLNSISLELYEAADIDGANRFQKILHISMPGLKNIIAINLILSVGGILASNSDLILLLYKPATYETADVIGTYIYRVGINDGQFSYTTAVGLFTAAIGFILTFVANKISSKVADFSLW